MLTRRCNKRPVNASQYGAGHASLAYVRTLPVHELKIDRSFITRIDQQPKSAAIVRSTIVLCRELGLSVVAEGVETARELEWLQVNRCDLAQGFGIGRPMPVHELYGWPLPTRGWQEQKLAGRRYR